MSDAQYERSVAERVFASELRQADYFFKQNEGEREPNYLLLPSGGMTNRILVGGTVSELEDIGNDGPYFQMRVEDGTGEFLTYAGQYSPEVLDTLRDIEPPEYVLVYGKANEYRPDDDEGEVIVTVSPDNVAVVSQEERDRWITETAESTIARLEQDSDDGEYIRQSREHYEGITSILQDEVTSALQELE